MANNKSFYAISSILREFLCFLLVELFCVRYLLGSHKLLHINSTEICSNKGFPDSSISKESTCNVGDQGLIPGLGNCPEERKGYPHSSILAWRIPWTSPRGCKQSDTTERLSLSLSMQQYYYFYKYSEALFLTCSQWNEGACDDQVSSQAMTPKADNEMKKTSALFTYPHLCYLLVISENITFFSLSSIECMKIAYCQVTWSCSDLLPLLTMDYH